jgi:hypothetical protein
MFEFIVFFLKKQKLHRPLDCAVLGHITQNVFSLIY